MTLTIERPEGLSRGLVLVKWWLLAIPHYLVLAVVLGSFTWASPDGGVETAGTGGLLGILSLIAVVTLLVRGRYPQGLFDLILGLNRWVARVVAYAALMTDTYPPFRLDQGGADQPSQPRPPVSPAPGAVSRDPSAPAPDARLDPPASDVFDPRDRSVADPAADRTNPERASIDGRLMR